MSELRFANARLDITQRLLFLSDQLVEVQPLVFDLLCFLARHPRRAISKEELLAAVWRSSFVSDSVVARAVMKARRALLDDAHAPRLLRSVLRVGYRLDADVTELASSAKTVADLPRPAGGALVILPFENATHDPTLDWMAQSLMGLLHHLLERSSNFSLVPTKEVNSACRLLEHAEDRMAQLCVALGTTAMVTCRVTMRNDVFVLQATNTHASALQVTHEFVGPDVVQLTVQLSEAMANATAQGTPSLEDPFWQEQFAKALGQHQSGQHTQALAMVDACGPRLQQNAQFRLLRARLLYECNKLDAAKAQIQEELQRPEGPAMGVTRVQLLALQAQCDYAADHLAASMAGFELALELSATLPAAMTLRADLLCAASGVAARQSDASKAIQLVETAVAEAARLGALEVQARAWLQLASMLSQMDQQDRAESILQHTLDMAHRSGVVEHEARAWRLQANVQNHFRRHTQALDSIGRSIVMWIRSGNVAMLLWARLMELVILIESDRLTMAESACTSLSSHEGLQSAHRDTLQLLHALIDWRHGRDDASFASLRQLTDATPRDLSVTQLLAHGELVFMHAHHGQVEQAAKAWRCMSNIHTAGASERRQAAVALASGDRPLAIKLLMGFWRSTRLRGIEGMSVILDLTWILLEDAPPRFDDAELETLFAHVVDFSEEPLSVRVVRAGYLMRKTGSKHSQAQWDQAVAEARPLQLRQPELQRPAYREALAHGSPPRRRELITRLCW